MKVCCHDCGKTNVKLFERPRTIKSGLKNTVDVCRKCQIAWYKKHKLFRPRYNFKCPSCGHEQSAVSSIFMHMGMNRGNGSCVNYHRLKTVACDDDSKATVDYTKLR